MGVGTKSWFFTFLEKDIRRQYGMGKGSEKLRVCCKTIYILSQEKKIDKQLM